MTNPTFAEVQDMMKKQKTMIEDKPYYNSDPKPLPRLKNVYKGIKYKPKGNTEQSDAMREKYEEQNGICEITGEPLGEYDPFKVHHFLSKKTYIRFKNEKRAMIVLDPDIHYSYHNNSREYTLSQWAGAIVLYDKADELRIEYNTKSPTI